MMTEISLAEQSVISVVSEPIISVSSSLTIFTTVCAGVRLFSTSSPMAFSFTFAMNSFTSLKLTSASSSAIRTSRSA